MNKTNNGSGNGLLRHTVLTLSLDGKILDR